MEIERKESFLQKILKKNEINYATKVLSKDSPIFNHLNVSFNNNTVIVSIRKNKNFNSMTFDVVEEMILLFYTILDKNKLYIIHGDNNIFTPGADIKAFYIARTNFSEFDRYGILTYFIFYHFYKEMQNNTLFIWNGVTMGGGLGMSAYSKYRIATETTTLGMPETLFGLFSNCIYGHFITKFMNKYEALHFSTFSHKFHGYELIPNKSLPFATHFILNKYIDKLINEVKSIENPIKSNEALEKILNNYHLKSVEELDIQIKKTAIQNINNFKETVENIYENKNWDNFTEFYLFLEKKLKNNDLLKVLKQRSIIGLKFNYDNVINGYSNKMSYEDLFNFEIKNMTFLFQKGDIVEGLRTFFVEKDNKPNWKVKDINKLNDYLINEKLSKF